MITTNITQNTNTCQSWWFETPHMELFPSILSNLNYYEMQQTALVNHDWNSKTIIVVRTQHISSIQKHIQEINETIIKCTTGKFDNEEMEFVTISINKLTLVSLLTSRKMEKFSSLKSVKIANLNFYNQIDKKLNYSLKLVSDTEEKHIEESLYNVYIRNSVNPEFADILFSKKIERLIDSNHAYISKELLNYGQFNKAIGIIGLIRSDVEYESSFRHTTDIMFEMGQFELLFKKIKKCRTITLETNIFNEMSTRFVNCGNFTQAIIFFAGIRQHEDKLVDLCSSLIKDNNDDVLTYAKTKNSDVFCSKISQKLAITDKSNFAFDFIQLIFDKAKKMNSIREVLITLSEMKKFKEINDFFDEVIEFIAMTPDETEKAISLRDLSLLAMKIECFDKAVEIANMIPTKIYKDIKSSDLNNLCNLTVKLAKSGFVEKANEIAGLITDDRMREFTIARIKAISKPNG